MGGFNDLKKERKMIQTFYGYNHNLKIGDGEFYDMKNMTSSFYPVASPRSARGFFAVNGVQGLFSKEKLCYIKGGKLFYDGVEVSGFPTLEDNPTRQMVSMGAYLVIFPDKLYLNTNSLSDFGSIEAHYAVSSGVTYSLSNIDGTLYSGYTASQTAPNNPQTGDLWLDTASTPHILKQYATDTWVTVVSTYVKISAPGIGAAFERYDSVTVSGSSDENFNTDLIIWNKADDYIIVAGIIDAEFTQNTPFAVDRKCPDLAYVCEGENRIWGCRNDTNEIVCCKLGDFKNWSCYMGLSSDSYAASVGSDGDYTGAVRYGSYTMFFKENYIHKVYNTNPPFNISTVSALGVQKNCHKSIAVINGTLFYKSAAGVCAYQGGTPVVLNGPFGHLFYDDAVAGEYRDKYYITMKHNGVRSLFVYDTNLGIWHKEDGIDIKEFCNNNSNLYFIYTLDGVNRLGIADYEQAYGVRGGELADMTAEPAFEWELISGLFGLEMPEYKRFSRIIIRVSVAAAAQFAVYIDYDESGEYELLDSFSAQKTHAVTCAMNIDRRADNIRLKIVGSGDVKIYSVTFNVEVGSELQ